MERGGSKAMIPMARSDFEPGLRGYLFPQRRIYPWPHIAEKIADLKKGPIFRSLYIYRHAATEYNDKDLISGQHDVN